MQHVLHNTSLIIRCEMDKFIMFLRLQCKQYQRVFFKKMDIFSYQRLQLVSCSLSSTLVIVYFRRFITTKTIMQIAIMSTAAPTAAPTITQTETELDSSQESDVSPEVRTNTLSLFVYSSKKFKFSTINSNKQKQYAPHILDLQSQFYSPAFQ